MPNTITSILPLRAERRWSTVQTCLHCDAATALLCLAGSLPGQVLPGSWGSAHHSQMLMQGEVEEVEHKLTEAENSRGQLRRFCTKFCTPVFLEAFVLTFLAGG